MIKELIVCYLKRLKYTLTDEYFLEYNKNEDKIEEIESKIRQLRRK